MRTLAIIGLLSALPAAAMPATAAAQEDEFDETERFLGAPPPQGTWRLDDGVGTDEVPWDDYDAATSYLPRDLFHAGLELRAGVIPTVHSMTEIRPQVELSGFLDWRYHEQSPWHMRIGLALSYEPSRSQNFGGGTYVTTSTVGIRLRVLPLSVDLGRYVGIRVGPDLGIQIAPSPTGPRVMFAGGGLAQLVGRFYDGRLEIGIYGGVQITGVSRLERSFDSVSPNQGGETYLGDATLGLSAGYLF